MYLVEQGAAAMHNDLEVKNVGITAGPAGAYTAAAQAVEPVMEGFKEQYQFFTDAVCNILPGVVLTFLDGV